MSTTTSRQRFAASLTLALALVGSALPAQAECHNGASQRLVAEMLFGRNIANRTGVSQSQFRRFLDREVTPRFPDGFTLLDSYGQWRGPASRTIVTEPGKVLMIALADEARDVPRLREIADAYKRRFSQQSVGIITRSACVMF